GAGVRRGRLLPAAGPGPALNPGPSQRPGCDGPAGARLRVRPCRAPARGHLDFALETTGNGEVMSPGKPQRIPLETTGSASPVPLAVPDRAEAEGTPLTHTLTPEQVEEVRQQVVAALKTCYDPEVPVNIYEMGLIYDVDVQPTGAVGIRMTLTSPACPV